MRSTANHIRAVRVSLPSNVLRCQTCNITMPTPQVKRVAKVTTKTFNPVKVVKKKYVPAPPPVERLTWLDLIKPIMVDDAHADPTPHPNARPKRKSESQVTASADKPTLTVTPQQAPAPTKAPSQSSTTKSTPAPAPAHSTSVNPVSPQSRAPAAAPQPEAEEEVAMTDEEFEQYLHEPLKILPSFDEVATEIDSLLMMDMRGVRMFPAYMREHLKLDAMKFMAQALAEIKAASIPVSQHQLQSRMFTFLLKRASKLAITEDERITILCPDAPFVGDKVPHPQWPEMTTVVKRYFSHSDSSYMSVPMPKPRNKDGKVRWSELIGANVKSPLDETVVEHADMQDDWIDLNKVDEKSFFLGEEKQFQDALAGATEESQRYMIKTQMETRRTLRDTIIARIQLLRRQVNNQLTPEDRKALTEIARMNSSTMDNVKHELAVVYKFDGSGDEFEMRYPMSTRDVERLKLFQEADDIEQPSKQ